MTSDSSLPYDLVVIGVSCLENIVGLKTFPNIQSHKEINIDGCWTSTGGNGLNVATYAHSLGMKVAFFSKVPMSIHPRITDTLISVGLETSHLITEDRSEAPHVILLTNANGEYSVLVSDRNGLAFKPNDLSSPHLLPKAQYAHIDAFTLGALGTTDQIKAGDKWVKAVQDSGALLSIDLSHALCDNQTQRACDLIGRAHVVFGNTYEATKITRTSDSIEAAAALLRMGPSEVIVKDGGRGLVCASKNSMEMVPAFDLPVADTIGAGDGVVAGTLFGLCRDLSLDDASKIGAAVAAMVCGGRGSQGASFDLQTVEQLVETESDDTPAIEAEHWTTEDMTKLNIPHSVIYERYKLPEGTKRILHKIANSSPLGTSIVMNLFAEALRTLAEESSATSGRELINQGVALLNYFEHTRGQYTAAVDNCFRPCHRKLTRIENETTANVRRVLLTCAQRLQEERIVRIKALFVRAAKHLSGARRLLLYDYSSTVMGITRELLRQQHNLELVVSESRTADGGRPIVEEASKMGCTVRYIPDAAIAQVIQDCDGVLVGVETVFPDGSFSNTVGTLGVAIHAEHFEIPFLPATESVKASPNRDHEHDNIEMKKDMTTLLTTSLVHPENVRIDTSYPAIEIVPGELVTTYLTEHGALGPAEVWAVARGPETQI